MHFQKKNAVLENRIAVFACAYYELLEYSQNIAFVGSLGAIAVYLVFLIFKKEGFQVAVATQDILETQKDPLDVEQQKQEIMISNLEDKIKTYKKSLQVKVKDAEESTIPKLIINNSCGPFNSINNQDPDIDGGNIPVIQGLNVNRNQIGEI